jgi:hypothetical protein
MSTSDEEVSPLLSNDHIREFFFTGLFIWMNKLGFCGFTLNGEREVTLYKDRGTYYEPFGIVEFSEGTETEALFISIDSLLAGFKVKQQLCIGTNGFDLNNLNSRCGNV